MPKYTSKLQESWLVEEEFKIWLQRDDKDEASVFCKVCGNSFRIANSGTENVKQHAKGKKHLERCRSGNRKISLLKSLRN